MPRILFDFHIVGIIRKPQKSEEPPNLTPCPYCENQLAESDLQCDSCRQTLPYCIITGFHILASDLSQCSSCHFPGQRSELMKAAKAGESCPMCSNGLLNEFPILSPSQIKAITYTSTKAENDEDPSMTNGNHVLNGNEADLEEDSEENNNPNSGSSNAGDSRPGSYK